MEKRKALLQEGETSRVHGLCLPNVCNQKLIVIEGKTNSMC